jgi:hypothetical protein
VLVTLILFSPTSPSTSSTARILSLSATDDNRRREREGPSVMAKLYLILATLFSIVYTLPNNLTSYFLYVFAGLEQPPFGPTRNDTITVFPLSSTRLTDFFNVSAPRRNGCLNFFDDYVSVQDLMYWCGFVGLIFWALFVRAEFCRVKERCVWITVTRVQDTFGFGRQRHRSDA